MKLNSVVRRRQVALVWLLSYMLLLVIPLIIGSGVYSEVKKILQTQMMNANYLLLDQAKQNLDTKLASINELSYQIAMEPIASSIIESGNRSQLELNEFNKFLRQMRTINGFVDDIYINYSNLDNLVGTFGVASKQSVYDLLHSNTNITYEQWNELMGKKYANQIVGMYNNNSSLGSSVESVAFIRTFVLNAAANKDFTIVIIVNKNRFLEVINKVPWSTDGTVFILNEIDNILVSTNTDVESKKIYQKILGESVNDTFDERGKEYIVTNIESEITRLKYVSAVPKDIFWREMTYVKKIIIVAALMIILIGGALSIYFIMKNYAPIRDILSDITHKLQVPQEKRDNEYTLIQKSIEAVFRKNEKIEQELKSQVDIIKNDYFAKLLKGKIDDRDYAEEFLKSYGISFENQSFFVALIYIKGYEKLFEGEYSKSSEDKRSTVRFIISNVVEELLKAEGGCILVEIDNNTLAYIIKFNEKDRPYMEYEIKSLILDAQEFLSKNFWIEFVCSLSEIGRTVGSLEKAYQQSEDAMEYIRLFGEYKTISYDDIKKAEGNFRFSSEKTSMLTNYVKDGDFEKASASLIEIFSDYFEGSNNYSIEIGKCLIFEILNSIIKAVGNSGDISYIDDMRPVTTISDCKNLEQIKSKMLEFLKEVCNHAISEKSEDNISRLSESVSDYVRENYKDINLSVQMIGEHFKLTPHYLSKLFKDSMGESLANYINIVRLEKAKELLRKGDMTVETIAGKTGYLSSIAFIRTFKKHEGITPGKYKALHE